MNDRKPSGPGARQASKDSARLFFALWPDTHTRKAITIEANQLQIMGRRVASERLHVTLRFLGDVPWPKIDDLKAAASRVEVPQFDLQLQTLGYFRKPGIAWLGPAQIPPALASLVDQVDQLWCDVLGIDSPPRFRPHVSLARKAPPPAASRLSRSIIWPVREFSLTQSWLSPAGPEYRDLGRWSLRS